MFNRLGVWLTSNVQYSSILACLITAFSFYLNIGDGQAAPMGFVILSILVGVVITLVSLVRGPRKGLLVVFSVLLPAFVSVLANIHENRQVFNFFDLIFFVALFAWGMAAFYRRCQSIMTTMKGLMIVMMIGMTLLLVLAQESVLVAIQPLVDKLLVFLSANYSGYDFVGSDAVAQGLLLMLAWFTLQATFIFVIAAKWSASVSERAADFKREFHALRSGYLTQLLPVLGLLLFANLSMVFNFLICGCFLLACIPVLWSGVSFLHCVAARNPEQASLILFLVYGVLFMLFLGLLPFVVTGWLDGLFDLRRRLLK